MGTRSIVAARFAEGLKGVYVHWDGYPDGRLPVLKALIERDGVETVIKTILGKPSGWSSLSQHQEPDDLGFGMDDGRFLAIPGYGVQYNDQPVKASYSSTPVVQGNEQYWTPDEHTADEVFIEYIYIIERDGTIKWAESMKVGYDDLEWHEERPKGRRPVRKPRPKKASVVLPVNTPDDWNEYCWPVPLSDGSRPGEVVIRRSDDRIQLVGVGFPLDNAQDARSLAAALLAAAEQLDAGVVFTPLEEWVRKASKA